MYGLLNNMRVVCDPNVHLSDPFIVFLKCFCMSEVSPRLRV